MFVWVWPINLWTKKNTFGGVLLLQMTKCEKSILFKKKIGSNFFKFFFAHLKRNLFLILKWFYFLIFAQNWPICEGFCFSFLKIDIFPLWWGGPPGAPWGVKIFPKMVPMIIIGHIMKVYNEKWAKKNFVLKCLIIQIQSHILVPNNSCNLLFFSNGIYFSI